MSLQNDRKRGQPPSSPNSPAGNKKPRVQDEAEPRTPTKTSGATKPTRADKATNEVPESSVTESAETTPAMAPGLMSPPGRQPTPRSPGPQDTQMSTQVASQFHNLAADEEEYDPKVWGYLDPITDDGTNSKSIKLDKSTEFEGDGPRGGRNPMTTTPKSTAGGFLIGRHPECDLQVRARVISNRHCIIWKEITSGQPRVILEDLSSNGTWVNSVIVGQNKRRSLASGDELQLPDGHKYHFRYPPGMFTSGFRDTYEIGAPLGSGHFATVYLAVEKKTGTQYAVKVFAKQKSSGGSGNSSLQQEVAMLMSVSHPNVLCLKGTYEEEDSVYLVLELAPGGELFNYIIRHQKLTEPETRKIFKQLLDGLKYLHDRNIVHRDIKPENILLTDRNLGVKLADFGLAKIIGEDSFTTSLCGTPSYVAPEILESTPNRKYDRAVDIWSLGVVLYICLCGFPPFSDELYSPENPYTLSQQIKSARYDFPSPYWDSVDDLALDLIERMLQLNPEKRITVDEALRHPWLREHGPADSCGNLSEAIESLNFTRRKVTQQRTLLAEAPGLANPASQNPSKVKVHAQQTANDGGAGSRGKGKPDNLDAQTKAFVNLGGKAGDETLYGDSFYNIPDNGEVSSEEESD